MQKRKLVLALMLSLMLLVTMIPSFSFADEIGSAVTSGNCGAAGDGSNVTWNFDTATGTLTISGTGAMADYVAEDTEGNHIPWDAWKDEVKEIVVKNGVTHIGTRSFVSMSSLNHVAVANSITSIGDRAFSKSSVKSVDLPASVTELEDGTFYECPQLDTIDLSYIQSIGKNVFEGCAFKSVELPSVQNIESYAFQNCTALESVKLGEGVTELLTGTFKNCTKLKEVELPNSLKTIGGYTFYNTAISKIDLRNIDTISSTYAFAECKNLENIKMDSLQGTLLRYTFENCTSLKSVTIPGTITSVESPAFNGCTALEELTFEAGESTLSMAEQKALSGLKTLKIDRDIKTASAGGFTNWSTDGLELIIGDGVATLPARVLVGDSSKDLLVNKIVFGRNVKTVDKNAFAGNNTVKMVDMTVLDAAPSSMDLSGMISGSVIYVSTKEMADTLIGTNGADGRNYAKWKTGVAVLNGGAIPDNSTIELKKLIVPEKKNAIFSGWYSDSEMTQAVTDNTMRNVASDYGKYYAKWDDKKASTIALKDNLALDRTYGDPAVALTKDSCNVNGSSGDITFAYQQKDGDGKWIDLDAAPTNAGTYRVTATVAEDEEYASATSDPREFTIAKADPAYQNDIPQNLVAIEGQTLADVTLPAGFTWDADETTSVGNPGTSTFTVTYTPADTDNYNTIKGIEVTVKVYMKAVPLNEAPVINAEDKTLTVGDKFDPMDGVTATDTEDGDLTDQIEIAENTVDTSQAGFYSVTYKVTDKGGATTQKSINVVVKEKTAPPTTVSQDGSANGAKTGDAMPIGMLAVLMLAAAAGIAVCGRKLYKSR